MRKQRIRLHRNSILYRVLALMFGTLLVMFSILYGVIFFGGVTEQLRQNSFDILGERVTNRENNLESDMLRRWANVEDSASFVEESVNAVLVRNQAQSTALTVGSTLTEEALEAIEEKLIYCLRRNAVTGVFVVFNGDQPAALPMDGESQNRAGLFIRDYEPESDPDDYSDLLLERAPLTFSQQSSLTLDSYWAANFTFEKGQMRDFYYKPYLAACQYKEADREDLGYWCPAFNLLKDGIDVITYSVPLFGEDGEPFGVMGIELTEDYLAQKLPFSEITGGNQGSFLLAVQNHAGEEAMAFDHAVASGLYYQRIFGSNVSDIRLGGREGASDCYLLADDGRVKGPVYGCVKYLNLYNENTPFEEERWALIGVVEGQDLLQLYNQVSLFLTLVLLATFLLGAISIITACIWFTKPITRLARQVREIESSQPIVLDKINIWEVDELSSAVENLSSRVADFYSRLSQIMRVAGYRVGAFEYTKRSDSLFYTDGFLEVMGQEDFQEKNGHRMQVDDLMNLFARMDDGLESNANGEQIYRIPGSNGDRWVRLTYIVEKDRYLGVVTDVTTEYTERKKIEYERDYDLLTGLLNRRAFQATVEKFFENKAFLHVAAAIMLDLDNLKFINDTYGHDCGDKYIRQAADVLKRHSAENVTAARMSGDEFYVFIQGTEKAPIAAEIAQIEKDFHRAELELPDGSRVRIRISGGVAWYPQDSESYLELMRYADFAMYRVKHTTKGQFAEFDYANYQAESFLLQNKEELNTLVEKKQVDYYFQPIVSVEDGSIVAYEALMRPASPSLRTPLDVLAVAKSQSKLYEIERLTWFQALETFRKLSAPEEDVLLFLNSIPNQMLSAEDIRLIEVIYPEYLKRLVVELTEEEKPNNDINAKKWKVIRHWGAEVALDDYGAGYNGESVLLSVSPDYLKIDRMLVSGADKDQSRRQLVSYIVSYAQSHGIRVIAEGVENAHELEVMVQCGVRYVQGYYLGKPSPKLEMLDPEIIRQIRSLQGL